MKLKALICFRNDIFIYLKSSSKHDKMRPWSHEVSDWSLHHQYLFRKRSFDICLNKKIDEISSSLLFVELFEEEVHLFLHQVSAVLLHVEHLVHAVPKFLNGKIAIETFNKLRAVYSSAPSMMNFRSFLFMTRHFFPFLRIGVNLCFPKNVCIIAKRPNVSIW